MRLRSLGCFYSFSLLFLTVFGVKAQTFPCRKKFISVFHFSSQFVFVSFSFLFFSCSFFFLFCTPLCISPHTDNKRLDMLSMMITNRLNMERIYGCFSSFFSCVCLFCCFYMQSFCLLKWIWYGFSRLMNYFLVAFF